MVPMCLLCSVTGVRYSGRDVNIFVQIGLVVLVGLACKNAILIVEYAKQKHLEGWSRFDATREACRLRLRPILMTSFAFIIGVIPLAVAVGAGAEMRRSLGIAVFSGMLGVTVFRHLFDAGLLLGDPGIERDAAVGDRGGSSGPARRCSRELAGLLIGYVLAQLGVFRLSRALAVCGTAGCLAALVVLGLHRWSASELAARTPDGPCDCRNSLLQTETKSCDFTLLHRPARSLPLSSRSSSSWRGAWLYSRCRWPSIPR